MFREMIIDTGLEIVSEFLLAKKFYALEIGCMYTEMEGTSTLRIANFLKSHEDRRFTSIERDPKHIDAAKEILTEKDPSLLDIVEFVCGNSILMLPEVLETLKPIDFALLDGGAHPEICLQEFEFVIQCLSDNGLIIIDDMQFIPSRDFRLSFGKGTLILPYLVIDEYLKLRISHLDKRFLEQNNKPESLLLKETLSLDSFSILRDFSYKVVSKGKHKMLIIAKQPLLEAYEKKLKIKSESSNLVKLMLLKTRIKSATEMLLGKTPESSIHIT